MRYLIYVLFLPVAGWLVCVTAAQATHPYGIVNDTLGYQMQLIRDRDGNCFLKGRFLNRLHRDRGRIQIRVYAMTVTGRVLWKQQITMDELRADDAFPFDIRIRNCTRQDPHKWEFRIKESSPLQSRVMRGLLQPQPCGD